jgi:hypothetical protein
VKQSRRSDGIVQEDQNAAQGIWMLGPVQLRSSVPARTAAIRTHHFPSHSLATKRHRRRSVRLFPER